MKKSVILIFIIALVFISCIITIINIFNNKTDSKNVAVVEEFIREDNNTAENFIQENQIDEEEITPSPIPTPIENLTTKSVQNTHNTTYYIKVNNQMNTVTIYTKDNNGEYNIPVKAMICSTGEASPKNIKYQLKGRWEWRALFGGVYGQYATHINGNILFHSVPYLRQYDHNSLEYWEYDKLGTTCSAGCVRLTVEDAKWIYYNCPAGTWVEFYNSSNPGPLGKPNSKKVSDNVECRNWDPTDSYQGNPWKNNKTEDENIYSIPTIEPTPNIEIIETPVVSNTETPTTNPTNSIDTNKTDENTTELPNAETTELPKEYTEEYMQNQNIEVSQN